MERINTITSLEVSRMIAKSHEEVIYKIEKYLSTYLNMESMFIKSTCLDANGNEVQCYDITYDGCEFIAERLPLSKGVSFTVSYSNKFYDLNNYNSLNEVLNKLSDTIYDLNETNKKLINMIEKINDRSI